MVAYSQVGEPMTWLDSPVECAGAFRRLCGVVSHVASDLGVGQLAGRGDRPNVVLAAQTSVRAATPCVFGEST